MQARGEPSAIRAKKGESNSPYSLDDNIKGESITRKEVCILKGEVLWAQKEKADTYFWIV